MLRHPLPQLPVSEWPLSCSNAGHLIVASSGGRAEAGVGKFWRHVIYVYVMWCTCRFEWRIGFDVNKRAPSGTCLQHPATSTLRQPHPGADNDWQCGSLFYYCTVDAFLPSSRWCPLTKCKCPKFAHVSETVVPHIWEDSQMVEFSTVLFTECVVGKSQTCASSFKWSPLMVRPIFLQVQCKFQSIRFNEPWWTNRGNSIHLLNSFWAFHP